MDEDRHSQFLIALGDLCSAAALGGLTVGFRARGSQGEVTGIPHPEQSDGGEDHIDDTGYKNALRVGDRILKLEDVVACTIYAPGARPADVRAPADDRA